MNRVCERCGLPVRRVSKDAGWAHTVPLREVLRRCGVAAAEPDRGGIGITEVEENGE
jgi:hypothetical protein